MCQVGRPSLYKKPQEISDKFDEYLLFCKENSRFPNIAGFCRFLKIVRETYYDYGKKEKFSDTIKMINEILEDETLQTKVLSPAEKIFYQKNKFGYRDKQPDEDNADNSLKELAAAIAGLKSNDVHE